jgi:SH3-like domain-containing protein
MSRKYYKSFDRSVSEDKSSLGRFENQVAVEKEAVDKSVDSKKESANEIKTKMDQQVNKLTNEWRDAKVNVLSNIRREPVMGSDVLRVVSQDTMIKISSLPGDFYKVKIDNEIGYIKKDLVTKG